MLQKKQKIIWLATHDTLEQALQVLDDNAILSAPVIDVNKQKIVGVLDTLDIVIFILRSLGLSPDVDFEAIPVGHLESLEVDGRLISGAYVGLVLGSASVYRRQAATEVVSPDRPLQSVVELFVSGVERVLVAEGEQVLSLYSQSDIVSLLAQSLHLIGQKKLKRTLAELNLASGPFLAIPATGRVLTALKEMCAKQLPAVAVVSDSGSLIANFSASNLKGLTSDEFATLHMSVADFLYQQRYKDRPLLTSLVHQKSIHPSTVTPTDTLEHALLMIAATRVHRVWVVNELRHPVSMLSIPDLLRYVTTVDMDTS